MAFGMALYFSLFSEPNIIFMCIVFAVGILGGIFLRKMSIAVLISFFAIGFGYAGLYTHTRTTKVLAHDTHGIEISGTITNLDYANGKTRIYIDTNEFGKVRVSTETHEKFNIGDKIIGNGGLFKPKPADVPNGFDFARFAYFDGISASGYINDIKTVYTADSNVYNIRDSIQKRTNSFLVDSLVLGYKKSIPDEHRKIWTINGVAHIWAISGYHMALITGWLLLIFYLIFRSCPYIVRRIPARIPALICSWFGLVAYTVLSGASVSTVRAFIMTTLIIIAFILGRNAISLRVAAIAFTVILALNPSLVMHAGFQLSFAAIFGLIWLWQTANPNMPNNKILKYLYTGVLTALVATVFTAPFIMAHFSYFPIYGIIGNIVFLPIFSFIIMPLVFIGTLCACVGISSPILLAHGIYDYAFKIANHLANLPSPNLATGAFPNSAIIMMIIGLACLIFIRKSEKFKYAIMRHINIVLCIVFCGTGIIIYLTTPKPVFYIANNHKLIGAVIDGKLKFNKSRDSSNFFAFDTWKSTNGEQTSTPNELLSKESDVYKISYPNLNIVYIQNFVPLSKNISSICADFNIQYFASYFDINSEYCNATIIKNGAVIYQNGKIKYIPSNRPWHNRHE